MKKMELCRLNKNMAEIVVSRSYFALDDIWPVIAQLLGLIYDEEYFYRNKITLHNLGLYHKKSKLPVKIDSCMLVSPKINEIIKRLQDYSFQTQF